MAIELVAADTLPEADAVGVFFTDGPAPLSDDGGADVAWLTSRGFEGKTGQSQIASVDGKTVVALGLGDADGLDSERFRRAGASFVKGAWKNSTAAIDLGARAEFAGAFAEGALLGAYRFNEYKSKPDAPTLTTVSVAGIDAAALTRATTVASAVCLARDLINHPAGAMTPTRLAEIASDVAERNGLAITVLDEDAIETERLGGLRGVSMGSDEPPRLIELTYEPENYESTIALVGKGITFDSGGLSLKPADGMMTMKTDMSGAAAVIATMSTLAQLAPATKVIGIVCATENLPGPKATKPGDVLRARNGKTIEVLNTDAEGRLVLADGLSLAVEAEVDAIVDLATLTGACIVALGTEIAGLMGNNDDFTSRVQTSAANAGEEVWHLPLPSRYRKHIDSEIADIKNIGAGKGAAGALSAGLFLAEFVGETPWVHLDIAGPARAEGDDGYIIKGGTGFGVRTMVDLIESYSR